MFKQIIILLNIIVCYNCYNYHAKNPRHSKIDQVFAWQQIDYDFDGILYDQNADSRHTNYTADQGIQDQEKFFIQYNNVPIGLEKHGDKIFITVPRRRHGIPSTLNYIQTSHHNHKQPALKPYPDVDSVNYIVSAYRPRADACGRLWVLDTGLLEVPEARRQIQPPAILIFNLQTDKLILRHELKNTVLVNERTPGGLTSITIDVHPDACDDAYAYINDLATEGLVVFSLKKRDSWRFNHESFKHDESSLNFTAAGHIINWKDGIFSIALSNFDANGDRTAYYHPLVSTEEFAIKTSVLKNKFSNIEDAVQCLGTRGPNTQAGSHAYHRGTNSIIFASVTNDGLLCWNTDKELTPQNVALVVQDHRRLVYISDLKIVNDEVWVLANQIPKFVYSQLDPTETNFYVLRANIHELIQGTICEGFRYSWDY